MCSVARAFLVLRGCGVVNQCTYMAARWLYMGQCVRSHRATRLLDQLFGLSCGPILRTEDCDLAREQGKRAPHLVSCCRVPVQRVRGLVYTILGHTWGTYLACGSFLAFATRDQ